MLAHEAALTQPQFDVFATAEAEMRGVAANGEAAVARFVEQGVTGLRRIWAGEEYDRRVASARALVSRLGPRFVDFLEATRLVITRR